MFPIRLLTATLVTVSLLLALDSAAQVADLTRQACEDLGNRFAKCELASAAKLPCPDRPVSIPISCRSSADFSRGMISGISQFQAAVTTKTNELRAAATHGQDVTASASVPPVPSTTPKLVHRRLTGEECARMERQVSSVADSLGMGTTDVPSLIKAARVDPFPEAATAMIYWVAGYNNESLIRYHYEMARMFGEKCRSGAIRADQ